MLSSITPVAERSRGHRYGVTASWFIVGAALGGATLAMAAALLALAVRATGAGATGLLIGCAAVLAVGACTDAGAFGRRPPFLHRQVDETWLRAFRPWVYGAGFGWQIGVGFTTYIMTAAVIATLVLAALTASPALACATGLLFGTTRGLMVLLSARATTPEKVRDLHRRLDRLDEPVRVGTIVVQLLGAATFAWLWGGLVPAVGLLTLAAVASGTALLLPRRAMQHVV